MYSMQHQISWEILTRVICIKYSRNVTIEEMDVINRELLEMIEQGTPLIHFISDLKELGQFPASISAMKDTLTLFRNPSVGWNTNCYMPNRIAELMGQVLAQI